MLTHPAVLRPADHAEWRSDKMGKSTIYQSAHLLVGLNAFEPGQSHALHAHVGMEKMYYVLGGEGIFLLEGRELPMQAGDLLVAPDGVPHGVRNTGEGRLLVLAVLAPAPRDNRHAHDGTGDTGAADSLAIKYTEIPSKSGVVATPGK